MWYKETGGSMLTSTAISKVNCPQYRNLYRKINQAFIDLSLWNCGSFPLGKHFPIDAECFCGLIDGIIHMYKICCLIFKKQTIY